MCFFVPCNVTVCFFLKGVLQVKLYCDVNLLKKSVPISKLLLRRIGLMSLSELKKPKVNRIVLFQCAVDQHVR